jgi:hypothetical protein
VGILFPRSSEQMAISSLETLKAVWLLAQVTIEGCQNDMSVEEPCSRDLPPLKNSVEQTSRP